MRTGHHHRLETPLAGVDAALTELIVLTPAVLTQEERPFQTPFFAPAHKSPSSGASSVQRVFRFHRDRHALSVDAGEQFQPLELLGVLLDYAGEGARNYPASELLIGCHYSLI